MKVKVWNNTSRPIGLAGITLPPGQGRAIRNIEGPDRQRLESLVKSGDLSAPGLEEKPKRKTRRKKPFFSSSTEGEQDGTSESSEETVQDPAERSDS